MTPTLDLSATTRPQQSIFKSRMTAPTVARGKAEAACAAFFAKAAPLVPLSPSDREALINAVVDIVAVDSGRLIPFNARPSEHRYMTAHGWAFRSFTMPSGARLITDVGLPGDMFAWQPAEFYETAAEIRACGPARVAVLRKDAVVDREAHVLSRCWDCERDAEARVLRSRLVSLGRRDARLRIAHFMSELHDRLYRAGLAEADAFECPLTQEQLADVLGLTSVHVNRVFQELRRDCLLGFNRPRVSIPDLARLHAEAGYVDWPNEADS